MANEQARAKYLERQMRHIKGIQLPPSESQSLKDESLSRRIQEYCSGIHEHCQYEKETHHIILESMKEHKIRQRQQGKKERDEIYSRCQEILKV